MKFWCIDVVSPVYTEDICAGSSKTIGCESTLNSNYTVFINEAVNGVKSGQNFTNICEYRYRIIIK